MGIILYVTEYQTYGIHASVPKENSEQTQNSTTAGD